MQRLCMAWVKFPDKDLQKNLGIKVPWTLVLGCSEGQQLPEGLGAGS